MTRINYLGESMLLSADDPAFVDFMNEPEEAAKLQTSGDFREDLLDRLFNQPRILGTPSCFNKLDDKLRFAPGNVTLWAGSNGSGKSLITGQIALDMAFAGEPVLMCSFEMSPLSTLARMVKQCATAIAPTRDVAEAFITWAQGKIWIYAHQRQAVAEKLLDLCRYAAAKKGIKHVFIDSLMRCVRAEDDYNAQKMFVERCCELALAANVHVHIVCHIRKADDEHGVPGRFDIKGTGAILDQVDTGVIVWRNRPAEEKRRRGDEVDPNTPDCVLNLCKSRHIDEAEGKYGLFYVPGVGSYTDVRGKPIRYPLAVPDRSIAL